MNRRRSVRVAVPAKVLVGLPGCELFDLSPDGLGMWSRDGLPVGSPLTATLRLDDRDLEVTGKVVRCGPSSSVLERRLRVGVEFDVGLSTRLAIERYLDSLASE